MQLIKEIPVSESIFFKKTKSIPDDVKKAIEHIRAMSVDKEVEVTFDAPFKRFRSLLKKSVPGRVRVLARATDQEGKVWRIMLTKLKRAKRKKTESK